MALPIDRITEVGELVTVLVRARLLAVLRPDKYLRMADAVRREQLSNTTGFAMAAVRCPDRVGLVDELGSLTWREIEARCNAFAAALQSLPGHPVAAVGVMCRNHRGFIEAVAAANKVGADVVLLNTSFAGPALAEIVVRENVDTIVYDDEFTPTIDRAFADRTEARRIVAWTDDLHSANITVEELVTAYLGQRPAAAKRRGKLILLTSGTTGTPKGASHSGGGANALKAVLSRTPWRAEETTVVVAPMFHAWGFSQLVLSAMLACTVVTRRKFDPEATLSLVDQYEASGLSVVPVMFDRIMELPEDTLDKYSCRTLRFASASGSRMRPDVVTSFMDRFGDIVYNNYNATEAGMIATATPADLRAASDSAGTPADGTDIRIIGPDFRDVALGEVGTIYVRNATLFDGYTTGSTKDFHEGFMSSGDVGRMDANGRLFVVGRDDEMIVSGGENVYPIEVERTLSGHADVAEASVIGVEDEKYGQRLVAFVVLNAGATTTSESLKVHVRNTLANYKTPRDIAILEELPRSSTGKIDRRDLQSRAQQSQDIAKG